MSENKDNCQICSCVKFKYSCPKCNILYCSVECYKSVKHQECSESFYRTCVQDELMSSAKINKDDENIYNILARIGNEPLVDECVNSNISDENEIDSDDEDDIDMAARLQGVNINDSDEIWSRLTAEEKHEFESLISTGNITTLLPQFNAWWDKNDEKKLIEEISDNKLSAKIYSYPEILSNIEPFENLCKREPSTCLPYNLCNILGAYTCTVRFFNGEHLLTPIEATKYIYLLSTNLNANVNFDSDEQAIKSIVLEGQMESSDLSVDDYETIYQSVKKIRQGSSADNKNHQIYNLAAVSDLWRLFTEAKTQLFRRDKSKENISNKFTTKFSDFKAGNDVALSKTVLNNLIRKTVYFLSFVNRDVN